MALLLWRQRIASVSTQFSWCRLQIIPKICCKTGKPSPFILYLLAFILTLFFSLSWVNAEESKKPKLQPWQINGIVAALDDGHDKVKQYALSKLAEYDQNSLGNKRDSIAEKAAKLLKDEKVDASVRAYGASALGNLGSSAAKYIPDLVNILKDEKVDASVRAYGASALGNLGTSVIKYIPDLVNILKDEKVDAYVRGDAARALGNLGTSAAKFISDLVNILKYEKADANVRGDAARALENLGTSGAKYEQACQYYLLQTLNEQQPPEELKAAYRILSNPMDLTLVALMLSQGKKPDLFHLQQQQYNQMAEEYQQKWKHEFPLTKFSLAVYQMQLQDEKALPENIFHQEIESMEDEKYKMVVSRQWEDTNGEAKKEWYFRHDKIMDFFLVQNFLGDSEEAKARVSEHMGDPRFRGVYFLLAGLLPLDAALELREKFILYAANTKDHTVTDTFVQLIQLRWSQGSQAATLKQVLRQQEQKAQFLDWVTQFLELMSGKITRERELYLTVETLEGSLDTYTPLPVLVTVDAPNDTDVIQIVEFAKKLDREKTEKFGLLIYKSDKFIGKVEDTHLFLDNLLGF